MPTANISIKKIYRNAPDPSRKGPAINIVAQDGTKYSDFNGEFTSDSITDGSTVSFEFKQNGTYNNVAGVVQLLTPGLPATNTSGVTAPAGAPASTAGPAVQGEPDSQFRSVPQLLKGDAMAHAATLCARADSDTSFVIEQAKIIYAWYLED